MNDTPTTHRIGSVRAARSDDTVHELDVYVSNGQVAIEMVAAGQRTLSFDRAGLARLRALLDEAEAGIVGARAWRLPDRPPLNVQTVWTGAPRTDPDDPDTIIEWDRATYPPSDPSAAWHEVWVGRQYGRVVHRFPWDRVLTQYGRALDVSPDAPGLPDGI